MIACCKGTSQNVVLVGCDHQTIDWQAHLFGNKTGIYVAEISSWHGKADGLLRGAQRGRRGKVIDHLRHHPAPIDRVDRRQPDCAGKGLMSKHIFDHRLAVIETTIDRYCMAIFSANSCHLASLEIGYLAIGEHEKCVYAVTGFERFQCCTTCVARRRPNNCESLFAFAQNVIHEARKYLHGYVFEGQGRSVKQLEKPIVWSHLHQRSYGGMMESRVSLFNHPPQIDIINLSTHKG